MEHVYKQQVLKMYAGGIKEARFMCNFHVLVPPENHKIYQLGRKKVRVHQEN